MLRAQLMDQFTLEDIPYKTGGPATYVRVKETGGDDTGLVVLRQWVRKFFRAYAAHATVIRILSQADLVPEEVFGDGLRLFFSIAEAMTTGMTAAAQAAGKEQDRAELTAVACLMMLERVNYLISAEVQLPETEMSDRIADIMFAAFGLNVP